MVRACSSAGSTTLTWRGHRFDPVAHHPSSIRIEAPSIEIAPTPPIQRRDSLDPAPRRISCRPTPPGVARHHVGAARPLVVPNAPATTSRTVTPARLAASALHSTTIFVTVRPIARRARAPLPALAHPPAVSAPITVFPLPPPPTAIHASRSDLLALDFRRRLEVI